MFATVEAVHSGRTKGRVPVEIKGITADVFETIVRSVSETRYDRNIMCLNPCPSGLNKAGTRFRQRVIAISSRGAGARRSWSGRRMPCACWHVFRDVVRATLAAHPEVTFRTRMAYYTSDNFESTYPATGYVNVGSPAQPAYLPRLCDCVDSDTDAAPMAPPRLTTTQLLRLGTVPSKRRSNGERDQELAIAASECAWCGATTDSEVFAWCDQDCQESWQSKYGAGLARV